MKRAMLLFLFALFAVVLFVAARGAKQDSMPPHFGYEEFKVRAKDNSGAPAALGVDREVYDLVG